MKNKMFTSSAHTPQPSALSPRPSAFGRAIFSSFFIFHFSFLLLLSLLVSCKMERPKGGEETIQTGDLLFISLPADYDLDDKSYVATSDVLNHIHVAILEVDDDGVYVIDATFKYGTHRHPLDTLLRQYTLRDGTLPHMEVKRLVEGPQVNESTCQQAIEKTKAYLGMGYDTAFAPANDALYCSELVSLCYLDGDGRPLFPLGEIDLRTIPPTPSGEGQGVARPDEAAIPRYWTQLCASAGIPLPHGTGIMPADIYRSPLLRSVAVSIP